MRPNRHGPSKRWGWGGGGGVLYHRTTCAKARRGWQPGTPCDRAVRGTTAGRFRQRPPPPPPRTAPGRGRGQGCIRREGTSEAVPEAVRQAVGGWRTAKTREVTNLQRASAHCLMPSLVGAAAIGAAAGLPKIVLSEKYFGGSVLSLEKQWSPPPLPSPTKAGNSA